MVWFKAMTWVKRHFTHQARTCYLVVRFFDAAGDGKATLSV